MAELGDSDTGPALTNSQSRSVQRVWISPHRLEAVKAWKIGLPDPEPKPAFLGHSVKQSLET